MASLEKDHAYLLSPNGPFGEDFSAVLKPYLETILETDVQRETCRQARAKAWIKAHSEAPGVEEDLRRLKEELNSLKSQLVRPVSLGSGVMGATFFSDASSVIPANQAGAGAEKARRTMKGSLI